MSCSERALFVALLLASIAGNLHAAEPQRLTTDGRIKADVSVLPNGQEVLFTVQESATQLSLCKLRLADGAVERVNPTANTSEFEACMSRDGRFLAFVQSRSNLNLKMVIRELATGKEAVFDAGGGFAGMHCPAIAPDSSRVVFSLPAGGGQHLFAVDMEAKNRLSLTQSSGINNWPAFSPDGRRIAFGSSRDGDFEIYVMDANGGNVRRLTESSGRDIRPAWSPDGNQIAFVSARDGNAEIYVMNADGSQPRRVTNHPERDDYPAWHPDGRRVIAVGERNGQFDLLIHETQGTQRE